MPNSRLLSHVPARACAADDPPRREAAAFLRRSASRLVAVLTDVAGEDGCALAYAFRDIATDPEMSPASWPLDDVIALLASADPAIHPQAAGLALSLSRLLAKIDAGFDHEGEETRGFVPAPNLRAA